MIVIISAADPEDLNMEKFGNCMGNRVVSAAQKKEEEEYLSSLGLCTKQNWKLQIQASTSTDYVYLR